MTHNPGDRHGLFQFQVPAKFLGTVLGPETYGWLVRRYGQATVDRGGIFRARILPFSASGRVVTVIFNPVLLTPSLPNFWAETCARTLANSVFSGPITNLLSLLCVLMEIRLHTSA